MATKITRRTRTIGWAYSDDAEPSSPAVTGTVTQVLEARYEALSERRRRLGPEVAYEPAHEVLWLGTERLGRLGLLDLLQLCRLVPGGPDPVDSLTLALVRP